LTGEDLSRSDVVFQIGLPPGRIDILTGISGLTFEQAWPNRLAVSVDRLQIAVIGRADLVKNKRASGRPKDIGDLAVLEAEDRAKRG
jgi:hypothetical protein